MMIKIFPLLVSLAILASCTKGKTDSPDIQKVDSSLTYLALGDSYTIGESVDPAQTFPQQTADMLRAAGFDVQKPKIIAVTGWTTTNLLNALDASQLPANYNIVTLLIGVNNQYQHKSLDEYKIEFTELINRAVRYAGGDKGHVFVLSIPDYSVTPFAANSDTARIAMEIALFNESNKAITAAEGISYIDITPISKEAATHAALITYDGLHPSAVQYQRWSSMLATEVKKTLK